VFTNLKQAYNPPFSGEPGEPKIEKQKDSPILHQVKKRRNNEDDSSPSLGTEMKHLNAFYLPRKNDDPLRPKGILERFVVEKKEHTPSILDLMQYFEVVRHE